MKAKGIEQKIVVTLLEQIAAINRENHYLNALVRLTFPDQDLSGYLKRQLLARQGLALFGKSFVVKDNIAVANYPLSFGLKPALLPIQPSSASIVSHLEQQGALLLGCANLDPFCLGSSGNNRYLGRVLNPIRPDIVVGGSSSGSAAAVAAKFCDFAIGTDFGGSIRIPAAACRLFGLKLSCTNGLEEGALLYHQELDSLGILARTAAELGQILNSLPEDQTTGSVVKKLFIPDLKTLRELSPDLTAGFDQLARGLKGAFEIEPMPPLVAFRESTDLYKPLAALAVSQTLGKFTVPKSLLSDQVKALLRLANSIDEEERFKLMERKRVLQSFLEPILSLGLILTPTLSSSLPQQQNCEHAEQSESSLTFYMTLANLYGLPALAFPLQQSCHHLMPSLQLIGPKGSERTLLKTADAIYQQFNRQFC